MTLANVLLWVQRAAVFAGCAALLTVFIAPRVMLGRAVGDISSQYEKAGLDTSACRSWTQSPYVTGDGRCLQKPVSELASRMRDVGSPDMPQEEPPLE